jgi:CheY-like chemotaxis protein
MTNASSKEAADAILHIVLIEDQDVDKIMIEQAFGMLDQPVILHIYSDGDEALKEIRTSAQVLKPDLIITDLRMPNKGGQDFIREIKLIEGLDEVPVAVLSGFTEESDAAPRSGRIDGQAGAVFRLPQVPERDQAPLRADQAALK